MKIPLILNCEICGQKLNQFETEKWNNLVDYWGGKVGDRKPKCRTCYHIYMEEHEKRQRE